MMKKILLVLIFCFCHLTLCYCLDWSNLHEEADRRDLSSASKIVQNNPDSIDDLYVLGLIYLNLHKDKEARDVFSKILSLDAESKQAKWGVAEVLRRQHNLEKSEEFLNEIISSYPEFSPAYISLAYIRYIQMDFENSVKLAYKVIRQGKDKVDVSNYVRAYLLVAGAKGMIAHYGGPISKVINGTAVMPNLRKAQSLQPNSAAVLFGLGSFYLLAPPLAGGNLDKVEDYYKRAIEFDPLFADVYVRLAQFYKIKGDNERYQTYLNKALEIDPGNELALDIKSGTCKFICLE